MATLLRVKDLRTHFFTEEGVVRAVNGVSYDLEEGETLGLVGESGCGKSVSALSLLRLIPNPPGKIVGGEVWFDGQDILKADEDEIRHIRGNRIAMVFQEPMTSLNPVLTIGRQITEALELHLKMDKSAANKRATELLEMVGIPEAGARLNDYPHQFSGGMRQRVMIAMALSCHPELLIADEPTTALDVTIQAQILKLMLELKERMDAAILLITHDLGVVAETCQRVIVMYAGRKVEEASVLDLFDRPMHPYTRGLMGSIPRRRPGVRREKRLREITGMVPSLREPIPGCPFAPRCGFATDRCAVDAPPLTAHGDGHWVACWEAKRVLAA
jgi:peptide/nickel transport system ATP-binding protein